MTIELPTRDGIELARYLLDHLGKQRLVVVGHSWGSVFGVLMVRAQSQMFSAYVGTGQVVAKEEKEAALYTRVMASARDAGCRQRTPPRRNRRAAGCVAARAARRTRRVGTLRRRGRTMLTMADVFLTELMTHVRPLEQ